MTELSSPNSRRDELLELAATMFAERGLRATTVRDIALIGGAQQVEHHEIAVYGTLRRWAEILGLDQDAALLESIEAEEENADAVLTEISDRVNLEGAAGTTTVGSFSTGSNY